MEHFTAVLLVETQRLCTSLARVLREHAGQEISVVILGHACPGNSPWMILNYLLILVLEQLSTALQNNTSTSHEIALGIG